MISGEGIDVEGRVTVIRVKVVRVEANVIRVKAVRIPTRQQLPLRTEVAMAEVIRVEVAKC